MTFITSQKICFFGYRALVNFLAAIISLTEWGEALLTASRASPYEKQWNQPHLTLLPLSKQGDIN